MGTEGGLLEGREGDTTTPPPPQGKGREVDSLLHQLEISLKRGTYVNSHELATKTLQLVERYVQATPWKNAGEVLTWLKSTSVRLRNAAISETVSTNIIQRLIKLIREEYAAKKKNAPTTSPLPPSRLDSVNSSSMTTPTSSSSSCGRDFTEELPEFKSDILNAILDLSAELESSAENIAEDAEKHIHQHDVILTVGKSRTVMKFLAKAKGKKRKFEVIIAMCGPFYTGTEMGQHLKQKYKIPVTLMEDTGVFSVMPKVSKVIIGTHTILANGGLKATSGCHPILLAAKYYNVPVLVLAPLYKLSPEYPLSNQVKITNRFVSPETLVKYEDLEVMDNAQVYATVFDYVPPELITLFVFNIGSHSPSYIYRLLHDTYPQE